MGSLALAEIKIDSGLDGLSLSARVMRAVAAISLRLLFAHDARRNSSRALRLDKPRKTD